MSVAPASAKEETGMIKNFSTATVLGGLLVAMSAASPTFAQQQGGILKLPHFDSPASMSILEEATRATVQPMMGVFNNLLLYDQQIAQSSLETVRPELATNWSWSEDGKELTFPLRQGVNGTTASRSPQPTSNAPGTS